MSKPNTPLESTLKAKKGSQLVQIVNQNQKGFLKTKGWDIIRENSADNEYQNIPNPIPTEQELWKILFREKCAQSFRMQ